MFTRQTAIVGWIAVLPIAVIARDRRKWLIRGWTMSVVLAALLLMALQWQSDGAAWYSLFGSQGKVPWYLSQMLYVLKWASQSYVLKLALIVGIVSLCVAISRAGSLTTAVLFTYTLAWVVMACVLCGKYGTECNYFMPAIAGLGGCLAIGLYCFVAHAPRVVGGAAVLVLLLCAVRDI